jgi:hypothetical protein
LARRHVKRMADQLVTRSDALRRLQQSGQIQVVTAMFEPTTGAVQFISD